jgi:cell division control protein 45
MLAPQIASIIMINCGGTVDLMEFLAPPPEVTVYVIDCHRPYHLENVREHNSQVHTERLSVHSSNCRSI